MNLDITVAIPVFNGEKYITDALRSIVKQTFKVKQIIISDNKSEDLTLKKVEEFQKKYSDINIIISVNEENVGFQKNFYKCFDLVKTDFLLILHADDKLKPNAIENLTNCFLKNDDLAVVGGNSETINSKGDFVAVQKVVSEDIIFRKNQVYEFIKTTGSYIPESSVLFNLNLSRNVKFTLKETLAPEELYWPHLLQFYSIGMLVDNIIENRIHSDQLHLENSVYQFDSTINYFKDKLQLANFEKEEERRKLTSELIKKHNSRTSIYFCRKLLKKQNNLKLSIKYLLFGLKEYPKIIFTKFFLKSILNVIGIVK